MRITATEAARNFSEVLNRVAAGEELEIVRNEAPVALIGPPRARFVSASRLRELLAGGETIDDAFADDLDALRKEAGAPPSDPWPS